MKSLSSKDVLIGLYESLIKDFQYIDPTLTLELKMVSRLHSIVKARGIAFFTITMPDIAKFLERGLRDGQLSDLRPPLAGRSSSTDARPALLHAMWSLVFDSEGMLLPSPNVDAIAGLRQLLTFAKKLRMECDKEKVDETLIEFLAVDSRLPPSHDQWDCDHPVWVRRKGHPLWGDLSPNEPNLFGDEVLSEVHPKSWDVLRHVADQTACSLGSLDVWSLEPKHGPGAVAEGATEKYALQHWPRKLESIFPADWFSSHDFVVRTQTEREFPSRVICVPKTQKGPRVIAAEPTAHQWCQGAIERWLRNAIDRSHIRHSIDLSDQSKSQRLALLGSIDGSLATVDLSAASDRLSTRLVEFIFQARPDVLDVLHASRTRLFEMPDGSIHRARKFACMGSACTFPVQTIVFTLFAVAAVLIFEKRSPTPESIRNASKAVRVFGDDIIIPVGAYPVLVSLLTEAGLKVNSDKSHATGLFREACGLDAYHGVDVTPAYFLEPYNLSNPESLVSVVACSNNFHRKGLWHAAAFLLNTVDPRHRKKIRIALRDVSQPCIFSYAPSENHLAIRVSPDWQTMEVKALTLTVKTEREPARWNASLLQFFTERGDKPLYWEVLGNRAPSRELGQAKRPKSRLALRWVLLEDRVTPAD